MGHGSRLISGGENHAKQNFSGTERVGVGDTHPFPSFSGNRSNPKANLASNLSNPSNPSNHEAFSVVNPSFPRVCQPMEGVLPNPRANPSNREVACAANPFFSQVSQPMRGIQATPVPKSNPGSQKFSTYRSFRFSYHQSACSKILVSPFTPSHPLAEALRPTSTRLSPPTNHLMHHGRGTRS